MASLNAPINSPAQVWSLFQLVTFLSSLGPLCSLVLSSTAACEQLTDKQTARRPGFPVLHLPQATSTGRADLEGSEEGFSQGTA